MLSRFQHKLAISPTSLHTVVVIVVIAWIIVGKVNPATFDSAEGIWFMLPESVRNVGWFNYILAILTTVLTIYILGELNISQILLRMNSRVISFIFAALITSSTFLHCFQPGYIVMFLILLSYFTLFSSYQADNPVGLTYVTFLYLGIGAIIFPKLIWLAPIYWLSIYILRAANVRSLSASVLGLLTPFWIVGSIAFCLNQMDGFVKLLGKMISFTWGGYAIHSTSETLIIWLAFMIFLISSVDFYLRIYLDKTRNRAIYNVVILHGIMYFILILLQPIGSRTLLPIIFINTSIIGGHFITNDDTTISNILVCMLTLFVLITFILSSWIL